MHLLLVLCKQRFPCCQSKCLLDRPSTGLPTGGIFLVQSHPGLWTKTEHLYIRRELHTLWPLRVFDGRAEQVGGAETGSVCGKHEARRVTSDRKFCVGGRQVGRM